MNYKNNTKTRCRIIVTALALTGGVAFSAFGQETNAPGADPMAAFKTDKGLISLT